MGVFTNTIGIDVSKAKLDVYNYKSNCHQVFKNEAAGFKQMLDWVKQKHNSQGDDILFCFEHTGIYALALCHFMEENKLAYSVISGLEIKRSIGITRGKNDKIDAYKIAQYAYHRREEIQTSDMPTERILKLKKFLNLREKMVKHRVAYQNELQELDRFYIREKNLLLYQVQEDMIKELNQKIKLIEKEIRELIEADPVIKENYALATSVKGVGLILGVTLVVYSNNFSGFRTWRHFASYVGIAPFEHTSGSSINKGKRVSSLANKRIKSLLANAAASSIQHDPEMRLYYEKRTKEGKNKMLVQNIIRNKIVARVFATVKRGIPYVNRLNYAA